MKILITGACGHIGSYLSDNIHKIKKVSKTILVDNLKSNSFNSLFNSQKKNNLNFFNKFSSIILIFAYGLCGFKNFFSHVSSTNLACFP